MRSIFLIFLTVFSFIAYSWADAPFVTESYLPDTSEFPSELSSIVSSIRATLTAGDSKEKLPEIEKRLESIPASRGSEDRNFFLGGYIRFKLQDFEKSGPLLRKSVEVRQTNPVALLLLARSLKETKKCDEALQRLEELEWQTGRTPANENNPEVLLLRAECLTDLGKPEEAKAVLEAARKIGTASTETKKRIFELSAKDTTNPALSDSEIADLAAANPNDKNTQLLYARSLVNKGDLLANPTSLRTGQQIAERYVKESNVKDETAFKILFDALLKRREYNAAAALLEKGHEQIPNSRILVLAEKQLAIEQFGRKNLLEPEAHDKGLEGLLDFVPDALK